MLLHNLLNHGYAVVGRRYLALYHVEAAVFNPVADQVRVFLLTLTHRVVGNLIVLHGIKALAVKVYHGIRGKVVNRGQVNPQKAPPLIQRFRLITLAF